MKLIVYTYTAVTCWKKNNIPNLIVFQCSRGFSSVFEVIQAHERLLESDTISYRRNCILYGSTGAYVHLHRTQLDSTTVDVYAHKIALLRRLRVQWLDGDHMECSHLCGSASCIAPNHLSFEPNRINNDRVKCHTIAKHRGQQYCKGHGIYPPCVF